MEVREEKGKIGEEFEYAFGALLLLLLLSVAVWRIG